MKQFITYSRLREISSEGDAGLIVKSASVREGKTVFLSHSSADDDLLPGIIKILEGHGGKVYVDKKDSKLKEMKIFEIASHLRSVVKECRKFVLLVTPRSKDSSWIPWELGLGDGARRDTNVALFPSAETYYEQEWSEQEYLGLYQRIIWGNLVGDERCQWLVLDHRKNEGIKLDEWLKS